MTDVAGISEGGLDRLEHADGEALRMIERQMEEQASKAIATADVVVLVVDAIDTGPMLVLPRLPKMIVRTKADLIETAGLTPSPGTPGEGVGMHSVSAHRGEGIEELKHALDQLCFGDSASEAVLMLNSRHLRAISESRAALHRGRACLEQGMELLASELREALDALGQITGQITPDDLLGRIFSSFCIGK